MKEKMDEYLSALYGEAGEQAEALSELFETAAAILRETAQKGTACRIRKLSGREGMDAILSEPFYQSYQEAIEEAMHDVSQLPDEADGTILLSPRRRAGEAG